MFRGIILSLFSTFLYFRGKSFMEWISGMIERGLEIKGFK